MNNLGFTTLWAEEIVTDQHFRSPYALTTRVTNAMSLSFLKAKILFHW